MYRTPSLLNQDYFSPRREYFESDEDEDSNMSNIHDFEGDSYANGSRYEDGEFADDSITAEAYPAGESPSSYQEQRGGHGFGTPHMVVQDRIVLFPPLGSGKKKKRGVSPTKQLGSLHRPLKDAKYVEMPKIRLVAQLIQDYYETTQNDPAFAVARGWEEIVAEKQVAHNNILLSRRTVVLVIVCCYGSGANNRLSISPSLSLSLFASIVGHRCGLAHTRAARETIRYEGLTSQQNCSSQAGSSCYSCRPSDGCGRSGGGSDGCARFLNNCCD